MSAFGEEDLSSFSSDTTPLAAPQPQSAAMPTILNPVGAGDPTCSFSTPAPDVGPVIRPNDEWVNDDWPFSAPPSGRDIPKKNTTSTMQSDAVKRDSFANLLSFAKERSFSPAPASKLEGKGEPLSSVNIARLNQENAARSAGEPQAPTFSFLRQVENATTSAGKDYQSLLPSPPYMYASGQDQLLASASNGINTTATGDINTTDETGESSSVPGLRGGGSPPLDYDPALMDRLESIFQEMGMYDKNEDVPADDSQAQDETSTLVQDETTPLHQTQTPTLDPSQTSALNQNPTSTVNHTQTATLHQNQTSTLASASLDDEKQGLVRLTIANYNKLVEAMGTYKKEVSDLQGIIQNQSTGEVIIDPVVIGRILEARLRSLDEEQQALLQEKADAHNAQMQTMTDAHNAQMQSMTDGHNAQAQSMICVHISQLQSMTDAYQTHVQSMTATLAEKDEELEALRNRLNAVLEEDNNAENKRMLERLEHEVKIYERQINELRMDASKKQEIIHQLSTQRDDLLKNKGTADKVKKEELARKENMIQQLREERNKEAGKNRLLNFEMGQLLNNKEESAQLKQLEELIKTKTAEISRFRTENYHLIANLEAKQTAIAKMNDQPRMLRGAATLVIPSGRAKLPKNVFDCITCYSKGLTCDNNARCENCTKAGHDCQRWRCSSLHVLKKCSEEPCPLIHSQDGWLMTLQPRPQW